MYQTKSLYLGQDLWFLAARMLFKAIGKLK